jgi:hypothetical protein
MGCNCGKKPPSSYVYTSPSGQRTTYRTEVEAQAAKIRDRKASKNGVTGSYVAVTG